MIFTGLKINQPCLSLIIQSKFCVIKDKYIKGDIMTTKQTKQAAACKLTQKDEIDFTSLHIYCRPGNVKKLKELRENLEKENKIVYEIHKTQDNHFAGRKHIGHLRHWNKGDVLWIGWEDYKNNLYALIMDIGS